MAEHAQQAKQHAQRAEQQADAEAQARREAIPRIIAMGLTLDQVAIALGLPLVEIEQYPLEQI